MFQGSTARRIRTAKDITLRELARRTGLSIGHLSDCERKRKPNVPVETAERWANGLGVPFAVLWTLDGPHADPALIDLYADNGLVRDIIRRFPSEVLGLFTTKTLLAEITRRLVDPQ